MSLLLCGDPHGQFAPIIDAARDHPSSAVVLLGDLAPDAPLHDVLGPIADRVWWIPGNHDADSTEAIERTWGSEMAQRNLHGEVVEIAGVTIAGLGNVFRPTVWMPTDTSLTGQPAVRFSSREAHARATPRQDRYLGGPHFKHRGTIYPEEVRRLHGRRADVLVTHEAGGCHPYGFGVIDELARSLEVQLHVHGHQHDARWRHEDQRAKWRELGFPSIGVGLRGITLFQPGEGIEVLIPGELDGLPAASTLDMCGGTFSTGPGVPQ